MAFKMKGAPMHKGTAKHASALKSYDSSPMKLTYKKAYAGLSEERKAKQSEADFITEAKAYNTKKYDTTEPTRESKKLVGKYEGDMTTSPKVTEGTAKKELASRTKTAKVEAAKLEASKNRNKEGLEKGELKKKGEGVEVVNKTNVESKRKVSVKEAKGRGTTAVKNSRKVFGRGSDEVKAAKKARKTSVKAAKAERKVTRKAGTKKGLIAGGVTAGLTKKESKAAYKTGKKAAKTEKLEKKMKAKEASSSGPRSASAGVAKRLAKRIANRKAKA